MAIEKVKVILSGIKQRLQNAYISMYMLMRSFFTIKQDEDEYCDAYMARLRDDAHTL